MSEDSTAWRHGSSVNENGCDVGRPPAIGVKRSSSYRPAPARLAQWYAIAPKYARLYKAMIEGGGVRDLARAAKTSTSSGQVRAMLRGAVRLGFVTETSPGRFELQTLPSIETVTDETVEALAGIGSPLFHGNGFWMDNTWPLYVHWCRDFKAHYQREYRPVTVDKITGEVVDEVYALRQLVRAIGWNERIARVMSLFIRRHPALALDNHGPYRKYGTTILTFCGLYPALLQKLEWQGILALDEDERALIRGLRINVMRRRSSVASGM